QRLLTEQRYRRATSQPCHGVPGLRDRQRQSAMRGDFRRKSSRHAFYQCVRRLVRGERGPYGTVEWMHKPPEQFMFPSAANASELRGKISALLLRVSYAMLVSAFGLNHSAPTSMTGSLACANSLSGLAELLRRWSPQSLCTI